VFWRFVGINLIFLCGHTISKWTFSWTTFRGGEGRGGEGRGVQGEYRDWECGWF
jgi:hypothetical protein